MLISRRIRWAGDVALVGQKRNAYRFLVENPEGKRPLGTPMCKWEHRIDKDFK
jgi:hypothetical protein